MEKMMKTAKRLDTLFKILFWGGIVCVSIFIVLIGIAGVFRTEWFTNGMETGQLTLSLGNIRLYLSDIAQPHVWQRLESFFVPDALGNTKVNLGYLGVVVGFVMISLSVGMYCYMLYIGRKILKPMIEGQPFHNIVSKNLKKLAWVILVAEIGMNILTMMIQSTFYKLIDIETLIFNENIVNTTYSYTADGTFIIVFIILMLLSYVFKYGEMLQIQADETL